MSFLRCRSNTVAVVVFDEETSRNEWHRRCWRLGGRNLVDSLGDRFLYYSNHGLRFDDEKWCARVLSVVEEKRPLLTIFDSHSRLHTLDENASTDMAYLYRVMFRPLTRDLGTTCIVLDHVAKEQFTTPRDMNQAVRGSGEKVAQVDRLLFLTKGQSPDEVILHNPRARNGRALDPLIIHREFDAERMRHEVVARGERELRERGKERDLDEVRGFLREMGDWVNRQNVESHFSWGDHNRLADALARGVATGLITSRSDPENRRRKQFRSG
jgi:hypothetical protein